MKHVLLYLSYCAAWLEFRYRLFQLGRQMKKNQQIVSKAYAYVARTGADPEDVAHLKYLLDHGIRATYKDDYLPHIDDLTWDNHWAHGDVDRTASNLTHRFEEYINA